MYFNCLSSIIFPLKCFRISLLSARGLQQVRLSVEFLHTFCVEVLVVEVEGSHDEVEHDDVEDEGVHDVEDGSGPRVLVYLEHRGGEVGGRDCDDHRVEGLAEALVVVPCVVLGEVVGLVEVWSRRSTEEEDPGHAGEGQQRAGEDDQDLDGLDRDPQHAHRGSADGVLVHEDEHHRDDVLDAQERQDFEAVEDREGDVEQGEHEAGDGGRHRVV